MSSRALAGSSSSKGAIPKQPSIAKKGSQSKIKKGKSTAGGKKKDQGKDVVEWQLPPFSVPPQKSKQTINWEKLRKDTTRRNAPEGEDIKEIRRIIKEVKGLVVPVHEFINMVSPYTSDNGTALRSVMGEDLESFRKLAKQVYETMTQDVSDVLVNEQLQMVQYYEEKNNQLSDKMMKAINEIYEMAPNFDFEKYLKNREDYVGTIFPVPREAEVMSDETCEMMRRQQAYHRLQWLKSEGDRMSEENKRLMRRLEELKKEQQIEQNNAAEMTAEAETKRQQLADEETQMKEKLEQLNESIEKSFIRDEMAITQEHNKSAREKPSDLMIEVDKSGVRRTRSVTGVKKQRKRAEWSTTTAADIEQTVTKETMAMETAPKRAPPRPTIKRPKGARARSPHFSPVKTPPTREPPKQASPFHYSPPKSPQETAPMCAATQAEASAFGSFGQAKPRQGAKPPSPFHYSPPKPPPQERSVAMEQTTFAGFGKSQPPPPPPQVQETRIEETTTTVHQKRPDYSRRGTAPRDTWGGFY